MSKWLELAERCEKATGPGDFATIANTTRDIMALLGYYLNDGEYWNNKRKEWFTRGNQIMISLDAITALIERELPGYGVSSRRGKTLGPHCAYAVLFVLDDPSIPGTAATEPLARCAAFCRAKAAKEASA